MRENYNMVVFLSREKCILLLLQNSIKEEMRNKKYIFKYFVDYLCVSAGLKIPLHK